jgi:uncharacterized protein YrrD
MHIMELIGRRVVDPTTAHTCGVVVDILIDATGRCLAALDVAVPGCDAHQRIPAESIARIGHDAVMLARRAVPAREDTGLPADDCLDAVHLIGLGVLDVHGDRVGTIRDARLDADALTIRAYALVGTRWRHWLGWRSEIQADEVAAVSRECMLLKGGGRALGGDMGQPLGPVARAGAGREHPQSPAGAAPDPRPTLRSMNRDRPAESDRLCGASNAWAHPPDER